MNEDEIACQVFEILQEFAARINSRMSEVRGGANFHGANIHGQRTPYASFLVNGGDDELCLMCALQRTEAGLECEADLSARGFLLEMRPVRVSDTDDPARVASMLESVREFAVVMEDRVIEELQRDARRLRP